jgi:tetratricopeptide (TPR) repeat protein
VRRTSKLFFLCVMFLALMCIGSITRTALADEVEAKARAQALFERGITAYKDGRFKDAIDAFLDAHREYPSPTLSFNAARAYEKMGDNAGALRFYREYLRQTPDAADKARVVERVADLEKKLVARGVQQITVLSNVTGAQAIIDGKPVGVTPWTGEIAPGKHELKLRQDGYVDAKGEFDLPAEHAIDFQLEMTPGETPVAGPAGGADSRSDKPDKDKGPTKKGIGPMTWVAFGVGVAALGTAVVFEQLRKSSEDDVKNEETQVARHDAYDSMKSKQTTARVLAGVGAAAILAGGVLLYFDLSGGSSEKTARTATPARVSTRAGVGCGPLSCGATLSGRF